MDTIEALLEALEAQKNFVQSEIRPDHLLRPSKCPGWTCREVLNHSVAVTLRFARFASGETDRPGLPKGDLVGSDLAGAIGAAVEAAQRAWSATDRTRVCHLTFGSFEAEAAAGINLVDVLAHGHDVSPQNDRCFVCRDELWRIGLAEALAFIGPDRDPRHYEPELVPRPHANAQERFLAYLGRKC